MFYRRSLSCLVALAVALSLTPRGSAATSNPPEKGSSDQQLYQAYSEFFFLKRDMDFAIEMSLRETFLAWLYQGINVEVDARSKGDPFGTLEAITPPELAGMEEESYAFPDSLNEAPLRIRYLANEDFQRKEFNHKYLQARLIKDRLLRTAAPEQKQRMFKYDLESTMIAFRDQRYREVILQSDELIDRYGFADVSDLTFTRAEAYFATQLYAQSQLDYQYVIDHSSDGWYRLRSLEKLIALAGDRGESAMVYANWQKYAAECGENRDGNYWVTAELTARYLMAGEDWDHALEILSSVPAGSGFDQAALHLSADCSLALLELDEAEAKYNEFLQPVKGKKITDEEVSQVLLKLGYVDFLRGRFDVAYNTFSSVEGKGDIAERSHLSAIWCLYRLSAYQLVIDHCNQFLQTYPQSEYFYEVRNLIAFSNEMMGQAESALENYRVVMSAIDDRQDFYDFNRELSAINGAVGRLEELEAQIFLGGERDLFPDYLKIHKELSKLVDGVKFARALKTTPFLKEVLKEQRDLYAFFKDQETLEEDIYDTQDARLLEEYQSSIGSLKDIGAELSAGVRYYMSQKSLAQREQDQIFQSQVSDSIKSRVEREWYSTREAIELARQYRENSTGKVDAATLLEISTIETGLVSIQDQILRVQYSLRKYDAATVTSNIDTWSDFAYQRYTYGGLNFDYLYAKENRIEELDQYIRQVGSLLQEREIARRDTVSLPAELVMASKSGEPPYFAPAVQLWGSVKPVSALSDETGSGEMVQPPTETTPAASSEAMPNSEAETVPGPDDGVTPSETPSETAPGSSETVPNEEMPEGVMPEGSSMVEPTSDAQPAVEETGAGMEEMETAEPDSLGGDTTGTIPPETGGNEEPQNGPSVP